MPNELAQIMERRITAARTAGGVSLEDIADGRAECPPSASLDLLTEMMIPAGVKLLPAILPRPLKAMSTTNARD